MNPTEPAILKRSLYHAFIKTIPIMTGFVFLGVSYGILMKVRGFSFVYPMCMALFIYGGSLEFVAAEMLLSSFAPLHALFMAVVIQARHLFYGISMLEKYRGHGLHSFYMIYTMCDESFAINSSTEVPEDADPVWFMFFVSLLNQIYWVSGATLGGLLGSFIRFDTSGLDFVMTALFAVIFLDNWLKEDRHVSSLTGVLSALICLLLFGSGSFLIPTMVCMLAALTLLRGRALK